MQPCRLCGHDERRSVGSGNAAWLPSLACTSKREANEAFIAEVHRLENTVFRMVYEGQCHRLTSMNSSTRCGNVEADLTGTPVPTVRSAANRWCKAMAAHVESALPERSAELSDAKHALIEAARGELAE